MKNNFLWILVTILFIGFTSCSKDVEPNIQIPKEFTEVTLDESNNVQVITFEANQSWSINVTETKADNNLWFTVSPLQGNAGKASVTITAQDNYSRDARIAHLNIMIDGVKKSIPVKQLALPVIADDKATDIIPSKGFFVANEDWLGKDNGTVNYFAKDGNNYIATYRAYRAANTVADSLGITTQFATIWGDNVFFCSKQKNRLVVADAKSLKKRAAIVNIGGDGRFFVGVDDTKGYLGHSSGIAVFDIVNLKIEKQIENVSGQIGAMCCAEGRVFAISQKNGLYIINSKENTLESTMAGTYHTLTISKDGNVWIAGANRLIKLNPSTLEKEEFNYPSGSTINSLWGAWNAGSLCASTQKNVLYWMTGGGMFGGATTVVKYDIETNTANPSLYKLGKSNLGELLESYGAGLRVDPISDELIITAKHSGWGASGAYNWIYKLDADGKEISNFKLKGDNGTGASWSGDSKDWDEKYFWFPAVPFFEDANKPQILVNQILLKISEEKIIDLNKLIVDHDNTTASIQKSVVFEENDLIKYTINGSVLTIIATDKPGKTSCTITVISNGVRVSKKIRIDIEK